jgi:osmotically-inducible protein OsmY
VLFGSGATGVTLANDAFLVQLVRGALSKEAKTRDLARPNVSSCKFVVTLHGSVRTPEERYAIEEVARRLPGVRGVVNKIQTAPPL